MIRDSLENLKKYSFINKDMDKVVEFLKTAKDKEIGKYIISDDVFILVQEATTKQTPDYSYEAHKNYIDIQVLLVGEETIYYNIPENCTVSKEYAPESDFMLYAPKTVNYLEESILKPNNFVVYFAEEPHCPACSNNNSMKIKKAVVKIKAN